MHARILKLYTKYVTNFGKYVLACKGGKVLEGELVEDEPRNIQTHSFLEFSPKKGTIVYHSCPGTSQQNGQAECKHRHILEDITRTLKVSSSHLEQFWGKACLVASYTINHTPSPR